MRTVIIACSAAPSHKTAFKVINSTPHYFFYVLTTQSVFLNYKEIVTDLIGIRVLHLFKDDWQNIHHEILNLWDIKETPQVNIRRGDYNLSQFKETIKDIIISLNKQPVLFIGSFIKLFVYS